MIHGIKSALRGWQELVDLLEEMLIDNVAATVPWLAPLIPAYIAYNHMVTILQFDRWIAFVGAAVIEFLGLAAVHTATQFWGHNEEKRKSDPAAPLWVAVGVGLFYLIIVLAVNVLLDEGRWEQVVARALLSLISVPAAITIAIRAQHKRRLGELRAEERERKERREQKRKRRQSTAKSRHDVRQDTGKLPARSGTIPADWRQLTRQQKYELAHATREEREGMFPDLAPRTGRAWHKRLDKIAAQNGSAFQGAE